MLFRSPASNLDDQLIVINSEGLSPTFQLAEIIRRHFDQLNFSRGIEAWVQSVYGCNEYIDFRAPWALRKTDPKQMSDVLASLFITIRDLAILIQPIVPAAAGTLLDQMGIPANERTFSALADMTWYERLRATDFRLSQPVGIFPRLELPTEGTV